jgi:hypothetical protein
MNNVLKESKTSKIAKIQEKSSYFADSRQYPIDEPPYDTIG